MSVSSCSTDTRASTSCTGSAAASVAARTAAVRRSDVVRFVGYLDRVDRAPDGSLKKG